MPTHLILLFAITIPTSFKLLSSCTLSALLPLYAPTVHLYISLASLLCCSLGVGYSSHPYVRIGCNYCATIFLFPRGGSLLSLLTIAHPPIVFWLLYFWWRCWSCMIAPRCLPCRPFQSFDLSHLIPGLFFFLYLVLSYPRASRVCSPVPCSCPVTIG